MRKEEENTVIVGSSGRLTAMQLVLKRANDRKMVRCLGWDGRKGCKLLSAIRGIEYKQLKHFTPSSVNPEGGEWEDLEGRFICPKCGAINRLHNRPEITALKPHFLRSVDRYTSY